MLATAVQLKFLDVLHGIGSLGVQVSRGDLAMKAV